MQLCRDALCLLLPLLILLEVDAKCKREPEGRTADRTKGSNGFRINVSGNPDRYVPGEVYTVTLQGWRTQYNIQKFTGFMLVVEPSDPSNDVLGHPQVGTFQLFGDALTKFSENCPNSVTQTSSIKKTEIQVLWRAPSPGSGCIKFKATVVEERDVWYMDDGPLTKELCEEEQENLDEQPEIVEPCCACDEAKYEVTFEGLWSRHTHPKDFPSNEWLTHFSDIIGASHSADYRVWEYGGYASDGLRQVAEWGATRQLEGELKSESEHIRTIIKARGLWYPNVNGKTFAVFRVDRKHHLMSLVSMLGPTPDWIVGVSALELCTRNCSWVGFKELNLYPWDAGTDSGVTYMSDNSPTTPREKIRRITNSYPNDPRSPFYDPTGDKMKPLAKLTIAKQRTYAKNCSDVYIHNIHKDLRAHPNDDHLRPECQVSEWDDWSQCSATCGKGLRMRKRYYINPIKADMMRCARQLVEKEMCLAKYRTCDGHTDGYGLYPTYAPDDVCAVTPWGQWEPCGVTCGKGFRIRRRRYYNKMGHKKCFHQLVQKEMCMASISECPENSEDINDPMCAVTQWSDWSQCSVTCGRGKRVRTRLYLLVSSSDSKKCNVNLMESAPCVAEKPDCTKDAKTVCMLPKDPGPCRGNFHRWYFNATTGMCQQFAYGGCKGNDNRFEDYQECQQLCESVRPPIGLFSQNGYKQEMFKPERGQNPGMFKPEMGQNPGMFKPERAQNPGMYKPERGQNPGMYEPERIQNPGMFKHGRGQNQHDMLRGNLYDNRTISSDSYSLTPVNCMMSVWSDWSECSVTCGKGHKEKRRMVKVYPRNGGRSCSKKLVKKRRCRKKPCRSTDSWPQRY